MNEQVNRMDTEMPSELERQHPSRGSVETLHAASLLSIGALIAGSGLPVASRERLSRRSYLSLEEAQAAIEAERAYLARLQEDQVVEIGGVAPRSPHISLGLSGQEQLSV